MANVLPISNADRRAFVGYIATAAAFLMAVNDVIQLIGKGVFNSTQTSFSFILRLTYFAKSSELLGVFLLIGAFLLTLDSDEEPKLMKIAIVVDFIIGLALLLVSIVGIGNAITGDPSTVLGSSRSEIITGSLISAVFAFAASAITWNVVSDLGATGAAAGDPQDSEQAGQETAAEEDVVVRSAGRHGPSVMAVPDTDEGRAKMAGVALAACGVFGMIPYLIQFFDYNDYGHLPLVHRFGNVSISLGSVAPYILASAALLISYRALESKRMALVGRLLLIFSVLVLVLSLFAIGYVIQQIWSQITHYPGILSQYLMTPILAVLSCVGVMVLMRGQPKRSAPEVTTDIEP